MQREESAHSHLEQVLQLCRGQAFFLEAHGADTQSPSPDSLTQHHSWSWQRPNPPLALEGSFCAQPVLSLCPVSQSFYPVTGDLEKSETIFLRDQKGDVGDDVEKY